MYNHSHKKKKYNFFRGLSLTTGHVCPSAVSIYLYLRVAKYIRLEQLGCSEIGFSAVVKEKI